MNMSPALLPVLKNAEYRGTTTKEYSFVDQKTGTTRAGYTIEHSFEVAHGSAAQIYVAKETPVAGSKMSDYKPAYKRGACYDIALRKFEMDKGVGRLSADSITPVTK